MILLPYFLQKNHLKNLVFPNTKVGYIIKPVFLNNSILITLCQWQSVNAEYPTI